MKTTEVTIGLAAGNPKQTTRAICQSLAEQGISAIVVQKESRTPDIEDEPILTDPRQWSGQPGKDLFFNGWKLLF